MCIFYLIYSTLKRKLSVEMNSFFFKNDKPTAVFSWFSYAQNIVQVKFWGILWERSGYLRKVWEVENGDICRTCVGLCWSDHPYTVAFIYLFSQWVMSVSSNGHSIEQIRTEMIQNSLHVNRLRIMFWIWSNLTTF